MNSSYKIVLLGAFALFVVVVAYVALFGGDQNSEAEAQPPGEIAGADDMQAPTPPPRETLADVTPPPARAVTPVPEKTIGPDPGETGSDLALLPEPEPTTDERFGPIAEGSEPDAVANPGERFGPEADDLRLEPSIDDILFDSTVGDAAIEDEPIVEGSDTGTTERPSIPLTVDDEPTPPVEPTTPSVDDTAITGTPSTTPRTYTVQAGDTFASIAVAIYGEERAWFDIAQANPSVDPKQLQVGQVIALPSRDDRNAEPEETLPPAPGADQVYTVRPGDNLSRIAQRFYKDSEKWDLIYARNRSVIGAKPDNLKVGMKLVIPQDFGATE